MVRTELKSGKAPHIDNVCNIILKKATGTEFHKIFAEAFTISLKLGFIPYVWKVAAWGVHSQKNAWYGGAAQMGHNVRAQV